MPRPASGRPYSPLLVLVCLAALSPAWARAQDNRPASLPRIDRIERCAEAVERHQPGQADTALQTLDTWATNDLAELKITVYSVLQLMRDPTVRIFLIPVPPGRRSPQVFYSLPELRRLLVVAARLASLGDN